MMKRCIPAIILSLVCICLSAQDRALSIYYISHSQATNEKALLSALNLAQPLDESEAAVFYLANSERPLIAYVNLPFEGATFDEIIMELNTKSSHEVYPEVDCDRLCEVFDNVDTVRDEFAFVNFNYYIDSMFWEFYRESVIAKMYYVLNLADDPEYAAMSIYFTEGDIPHIDESRPFGPNNLCAGYELLPLILYE